VVTLTGARLGSQVYQLFLDVKRSTQYMREYEDEYMFNEIRETNIGVTAGDHMET
jgi:hypothetical protein